MRRITAAVVGLLVSLLPLLGTNKSSATGAALIVELQTGSAISASSEFVRIANISSASVDLTGWQLKSTPASGNPATPADQTKRLALAGSLAAGDNLLVATSSYQTSETHQTMSAGLAADGHVELLDKNAVIQDMVGWGAATHPEGVPAPKPAGGQSLLRRINAGDYVDTDNNQADFVLGEMSSTNATLTPTTPADPGVASALEQPIITELLPNPAAPMTDDKDEFVELYNPNSISFPLKGYKLQTGSSFSYSLTFDGESLPASGYGMYTSGNTNLTLSNAAGGARLLNPSGAVSSQTGPYSAAGEGEAWALIDNTWKWTTTPTPGADNNLSTVPVAGSAAAAKAAKASAAAKKTAVKAAKTTKPKTTKATKSTGSASGPGEEDGAKPNPLHPFILAGVGGLAVVYGVYEYRHDIQNAFYKFRRYRTARRETRQSP